MPLLVIYLRTFIVKQLQMANLSKKITLWLEKKVGKIWNRLKMSTKATMTILTRQKRSRSLQKRILVRNENLFTIIILK